MSEAVGSEAVVLETLRTARIPSDLELGGGPLFWIAELVGRVTP